METIKVKFSSFVDLQSRLILLPRVEEEGLGAVVSYYTAENLFVTRPEISDSFEEEKKIEEEKYLKDIENERLEVDSVTEDITSTNNDLPSLSSTKNKKMQESPANENKLETNLDEEIKPQDVIGKVLTCVDGLHSNDDWLEKDFSQILASIRDAPSPIVLNLQSQDDQKYENLNDEEEGNFDTRLGGTLLGKQQHTSTLNSWSSWGKSLAASAASRTKEYASSQATALAEARASRLAKVSAPSKHPSSCDDTPTNEQKAYDIFVELDDGLCVPISSPSNNKPIQVRNSSLLSVRQTSGELCPTGGYRFQWYRLNLMNNISIQSKASQVCCNSLDTMSLEDILENGKWTILEGENSSAYRPNVTDVGYYLICAISIEVRNHEIQPSEDNQLVREENIIHCSTLSPVAGEMSHLNSARHSLLQGAKFLDLIGRGAAAGRQFLLEIDTTTSSKDKIISSAITISQISDVDAQPIHSGVVKKASAIVNSSNSTLFSLLDYQRIQAYLHHF